MAYFASEWSLFPTPVALRYHAFDSWGLKMFVEISEWSELDIGNLCFLVCLFYRNLFSFLCEISKLSYSGSLGFSKRWHVWRRREKTLLMFWATDVVSWLTSNDRTVVRLLECEEKSQFSNEFYQKVFNAVCCQYYLITPLCLLSCMYIIKFIKYSSQICFFDFISLSLGVYLWAVSFV